MQEVDQIKSSIQLRESTVPVNAQSAQGYNKPVCKNSGLWTKSEHAKFIDGMINARDFTRN